MIHPAVEIVDLDPAGFAWLNGVVGRRTSDQSVLSVLHDGERVVQAVHSRHGAVSAPEVDLLDPPVAAAQLRQATAVDRVILLDLNEMEGLSADLVELAASTPVQSELLLGAQDRFWMSPAVATDPAPPPSPWPPVVAALRSLDRGRVLFGVWDGDPCLLTLVCDVDDGLVRSVRSMPHPPPRSRCAEAVEDSGADAALLVDSLVAERVLLAPSPLRALAAARDGGDLLVCVGLEGAKWPAAS